MTKVSLICGIVLAVFTLEVISQRGGQYFQQQQKPQQQQYNPFQQRPQQQQQQQQQVSPSRGASCPEKNGRYPVTGECDAYIECKDGVGEQKYCPDGLLFNANVSVFSFPCQYPIDVSCEGRTKTQPAQPTEDCPHQFGYFRLGDASHCGQFMNCVDGRGYTFDCPEGLAFSADTYRCDWPDQVPDCDAEAFLGFSCPPEQSARGLGAEEYRYFRSTDCQHYYICVNSHPRLYNCGEGNAFNDLINACDAIENVTACADVYARQLKDQDANKGIDLRFKQKY